MNEVIHPGRQRGHLELMGVSKRFGDLTVVDELDLVVESREFLSLLGPSGCGKSTTLRMIAGLEQPTVGRVVLDGRDMTDEPAHKRPVHTVFQSYALFPHLSVAANVAYPLRLRKTPKAEIAARVSTALGMVQMSDYADRHPRQLSGGQQQRVALARAIVGEPDVLLLDEPLSALDLKLRQAMRLELKRLHGELGITFIFVTHDQGEALTMSDRVAVMHGGKILQLGSPETIYESPASKFVASFIGDANLVDAKVVEVADGTATALIGNGRLVATCQANIEPGDSVAVSIRPQRVEISLDGTGPTGVLTELVYLGDTTSATVHLDDSDMTLTAVKLNIERSHPFGDLRPGDPIRVSWQADAAQVLVG